MHNGEVVWRNTFRHLRQDEYESQDNKKARSEFYESVTKRYAEPLCDKDTTPEFDISAITRKRCMRMIDLSKSLSLKWIQ
jgi:hypothetical protein